MIIKHMGGPFDDYAEEVPDNEDWHTVRQIVYVIPEGDGVRPVAAYRWEMNTAVSATGKVLRAVFQYDINPVLAPGATARIVKIKPEQLKKI